MAGSLTVRTALVELRKDLAPDGFIPDGPAMHVRSSAGDYVIVELQRCRNDRTMVGLGKDAAAEAGPAGYAF